LGLGVEGAGSAVREGQSLLQRGEVAGVGRGYVVGLIVEVALEDSGGRGLAADDGRVDAFAGERVDEAGSVADEQDATLGDVGVAAHAELLAGDMGEGGDAELLVGVVEEEGASDVLRGVLRGRRVLRRSFVAAGGEGSYADVDVVGLGEEPAVAAGEGREVEDQVVGSGAVGKGCGERGEGDGGLERKAVVLQGGCAVLTHHTAGLAVGAVGADEDRGTEGFGAAGGGDVELDAIGEFTEGDDAVDLAQLDTAALARGEEGLLKAEVVELFAHGHGADGVAGFHAHVGVAWLAGFGLVGGLKHDLVADALDDGVDGVAKGFEGFAGETAGARLVAREGALVEQDDVLAGLREVVCRGAACWTCTDDEDVHFANHGQKRVYSCEGMGDTLLAVSRA